MQIHNAIITGSFSYNGADLSNVTSSNAYSASLSSRTTDLESTSSVLVGASSSFSSVLSSVSSSQQQISASYIALSASYNTFSGSASTRITVDSASLLQVSASQQQISASLLQVSASYTSLSGSYNVFSGSASTRTTQIEQVYATTGSNSFRANQSITGSLTVTGQIIAQTINVQQVTSSIIYSSGSNVFGCDLNSRQTFTGSMFITGSNITANVGTACFSGTICASNLAVSSSATCTSFIQSNSGVSALRINSADSADLFLGRCDNLRYTSVLYSDSTQFPCAFRWSVGMRTAGSNYNIYNEVCSSVALFVCQNNNFVGIGTATPAELLTLYRNANADNRLSIYQGTSGYASAINLIGNDDAGTAYNAILSRTGAGASHWQIGGGGTANTMLMYTAGCERMRITSGGNVGINCSAPSGKLQVANSSTQYAIYTSGGNLELYTPEGNCGYVRLGSAYNLNGLYGGCGLNYLAAGTSNHIFYTTDSPTERIRISCAGIMYAKCAINLTDVVCQSDADTWPVLNLSGANGTSGITNTSSPFDWGFIKGSTARGYYSRQVGALHMSSAYDQGFYTSGWVAQFVMNGSNGNAYLRGTLTQGSDCRLKTNICNLNYGISEIMQLRPISYNRKTFERDNCGNILSEGVDMCNKYIGFIAQEIKPIIPEVVNGNENSENPEQGLSIEYQNMTALLVKGMQEQQCTINTLKTCLGIN